MLDELRREHVEVAMSRGMSKRSVVRRHVLRNALGPILTITGLLVAGLLVASAVVETAFSLNGMGSLLVQSVDKQDFAIVQAIVLLVVFAFVDRQHDRRHRLPVHRSAGQGRECGPMSILVGVEPKAGRMSRLRSFGGSWLFVLSCAVLVGFVLLAIFAPLLAPYPPDATDLLNSLAPPSAEHWLGTNQVGQDTLSRIIYGSRTSLIGPLSIVVLSTILGILLGLLAGWRGGWVDAALEPDLRHHVRVPRPAARDPGRRAVRQGSAGAGDRDVDRLHAVRRSPGPQPGDAGQGAALHRGLPGAGLRLGAHRLAAAAAEHRPDRARAVDAELRLRRHRPGGAVVPRPRRPAADPRLGRDDQRGPRRHPGRDAAVGDRAGVAIIIVVVAFNVVGEELADRIAGRDL